MYLVCIYVCDVHYDRQKRYGYMTSLLFDGEFYCGATAYIFSSLLVVTTFFSPPSPQKSAASIGDLFPDCTVDNF